MAFDVIIDDTREFEPVIMRGVPGASLEEACKTLSDLYDMRWIGLVDGQFFALKPDVFCAWNKPDNDPSWDLESELSEMVDLVKDGLTEARGLFTLNENSVIIHEYPDRGDLD